MRLFQIRELLQAEVLWGEELLDIEVSNACSADLMSDILSDTKTNAILLTGLTYRQIIQTASMSNFMAIAFVREKKPQNDVIELAKKEQIPLLRTTLPMFEASGILYHAGLGMDNRRAPKLSEQTLSKESQSSQTMKLAYSIEGNDFNNAGKATEQVKKVLKQIGIDSSIIRRVSISAYEAEMNIIIHANRGRLSFSISPASIEAIAEDEGPGIADVEKAILEGFSTAPEQVRELGFGAGMGLPNIKKFSDTFEISSVVGKGTKVRMVVNLSDS